MMINFSLDIFQEGIIVFPNIPVEATPRRNPLDVIIYSTGGPPGPQNIQNQGTIGTPNQN